MELTLGVIGACVGAAGMIFGFVAMLRNKKTDDKNEGEHEGAVRADLGYIKKGIDGIEHRMEKLETKYVDVIKVLEGYKDDKLTINETLALIYSYTPIDLGVDIVIESEKGDIFL